MCSLCDLEITMLSLYCRDGYWRTFSLTILTLHYENSQVNIEQCFSNVVFARIIGEQLKMTFANLTQWNTLPSDVLYDSSALVNWIHSKWLRCRKLRPHSRSSAVEEPNEWPSPAGFVLFSKELNVTSLYHCLVFLFKALRYITMGGSLKWLTKLSHP